MLQGHRLRITHCGLCLDGPGRDRSGRYYCSRTNQGFVVGSGVCLVADREAFDELALVVGRLPSCSWFPRSCCRFEYVLDCKSPTRCRRHHGCASCQRAFWRGSRHLQSRLARVASCPNHRRHGAILRQSISRPCTTCGSHHNRAVCLDAVSVSGTTEPGQRLLLLVLPFGQCCRHGGVPRKLKARKHSLLDYRIRLSLDNLRCRIGMTAQRMRRRA